MPRVRKDLILEYINSADFREQVERANKFRKLQSSRHSRAELQYNKAIALRSEVKLLQKQGREISRKIQQLVLFLKETSETHLEIFRELRYESPSAGPIEALEEILENLSLD